MLKFVGKKVILRPHKNKDAPYIVNGIGVREVSKFLSSVPYPYGLKDAKSFIKNSRAKLKEGKSYNFAIVLPENDQVIGGIGFSIKRDCVAMGGYWLGQDHWGKGYMEEALKLLLEFAFEDLKLFKIIAYVFDPNIASMKLLQKGGFQLEGILRKHHICLGKRVDVFIFSLLAEDYFKEKS